MVATWEPYVSEGGGSVVGDLRVLRGVESTELGNARDVYVLLPSRYGDGLAFPLLVMHDGQNLFDATQSYSGEWEVDETMAVLAKEGIEAIVVGVPNAGDNRALEYSPGRGAGRAPAYVSFLVDTVPLVRRSFATIDGPEHTAIVGSSLGGLVSLYALLERPDTFGLAGVLSPAFWWSSEGIFDWVAAHADGHGRIWMDVGDAEDPESPERERAYVADMLRMAEVLASRGYAANRLSTRVVAGGIHRESAWAARLPDALRFLLAPEPPQR